MKASRAALRRKGKEGHLSLTINTEVDVPLGVPRSVDCHTRVCPRVTELGTGQGQHPAPRQHLQQEHSTCSRSTAPSTGAQHLRQEHSTFRHSPGSNTARGALRAHFKIEHLFCRCFPASPGTLQCSLLIQTCKSRTLTPCQSLGNCWHSQDFAGSEHPSLPPTSFKYAVTSFVCALSCPHRTQIPPLPLQIYKINFQKPTTASCSTSEISSYIRGWFSILNHCCM